MKKYLYIHLLLLFYSLTAVFSKLAGMNEFLSFKFIVFYLISLIILFTYAIFWQQILKYFTLTNAFIQKGITLIWGMLFGLLFFNETITIKMIIGAVIVLIGIKVASHE